MYELLDFIVNNNKTDLIFDFDKTLFKLLLDWDNYFNNIENDLLKLDKKLLLKYEKGEINWCVMQNLYVEKYGLPAWKLIRLNNIEADLTLLKDYLPNPDLINIIKDFQTGYNLYIWSSNTKELVEKILLKENLLYKFKKVVCSNDVCFLKPKIDGFLKIKNNTTPLKNYLMIGDSKNDENAAISSAIDFYQVNYFN